MAKYNWFNSVLIFAALWHATVRANPGDGLVFSNNVDSSRAVHETAMHFSSAVFQQSALFQSSVFQDSADFKKAHFKGYTRFDSSSFQNYSRFNEATFDQITHFFHARFSQNARFFGTIFNDEVSFNDVQFYRPVFFHNAQFHGPANFTTAHFHAPVDFLRAQFNAPVYFEHATFNGDATFYFCQINAPLMFEDALADTIIFHGAMIRDKIYLGSVNLSRYPTGDFTKASFTEPEHALKSGKKTGGGEIILVGPARVSIQIEKFGHLSICDTLDYFTKKNIIATLKDESFSDDDQATERFELDYLLARSTMHQDKSSIYGRTKFYQVHKWPHWFLTELYYLTMRLGYRPFNLLYWALATVLIFTVIYANWIPDRLKEFIALDWKHRPTHDVVVSPNKWAVRYENALVAFYFSAAIFFALRFNKDLFNFFGRKEKIWISFEWLLGIIFYVAFFALAQSGSILHRLLGLFV